MVDASDVGAITVLLIAGFWGMRGAGCLAEWRTRLKRNCDSEAKPVGGGAYARPNTTDWKQALFDAAGELTARDGRRPNDNVLQKAYGRWRNRARGKVMPRAQPDAELTAGVGLRPSYDSTVCRHHDDTLVLSGPRSSTARESWTASDAKRPHERPGIGARSCISKRQLPLHLIGPRYAHKDRGDDALRG
jgi:hypothetical protein